jgi:hypothetical protein
VGVIQFVPPPTSPAPPSGTLDATYDFTSTGLVTFGLVAPQGAVPAGSGVQVGALTTQTDVKRTWSDGSAKHMLVSANIPSTGARALSVITNPGGSLTPTWPTASVAFVISGTTWTATLPSFDGTDTWANGAIMREARVWVTPMSGATPHTYLRVCFDVRSYTGDAHRVDVQVENAFFDLAGTNQITYDVTVTVAGSSVFTQSAVVHYSYAAWRKLFWTGGSEAVCTPDWTPFYAAKAIPQYDPIVNHTTFPVTDQTKWGLFKIGGDEAIDGGFPVNLGAGGYHRYTALLPAYDVQYILHPDSAQAREWCLACHGNAITARSWRYRRSTTNEILNLVTFPNFYTPFYDDGVHNNGVLGPANSHAGALYYTEAGFIHNPAVSYFPFLFTGDRCHLDNQKLWATQGIAAWQWLRNGAQCTFVEENEVRSVAWGLRVLIHLTSYIPDADADKTYWDTIRENNLSRLATIATTTFAGTSLNHMWTGYNTNEFPSDNEDAIKHWMHIYVMLVLHWAELQGYTTASALATRLYDYFMNLLTAWFAIGTNESKRSYFAYGPYFARKRDGSALASFTEMYTYHWDQMALFGAGYGHKKITREQAGNLRSVLPVAAARGYGIATTAMAFIDAHTADPAYGDAVDFIVEYKEESEYAYLTAGMTP